MMGMTLAMRIETLRRLILRTTMTEILSLGRHKVAEMTGFRSLMATVIHLIMFRQTTIAMMAMRQHHVVDGPAAAALGIQIQRVMRQRLKLKMMMRAFAP